MYPNKAMLEYAEIVLRRQTQVPQMTQEEFIEQTLRKNPHLRKKFDNSFTLVPTRCVGMQLGRAAPSIALE